MSKAGRPPWWAVGLLLVVLLVVGGLVVRAVGGDEEDDPELPSPSARQDLAATALASLRNGVDEGRKDLIDAAATDEVAARVAGNARELRVVDFSLRYVDEDRGMSASLPQGQWAAAVDAAWRFDEFDPAPARAEITVVFEVADGRARVIEFGGGSRRTPLWLLSELAVDRSPEALVMVAGDSAGDYATQAREAVRVAARVLPEAEQGLVVEVPASTAQLHEMLDAEAGEYDNIAAVTTTVDGSLSPTAPVHVLVNPQMWAGLQPQGAQVVMSHEAVHVVTGAALTSGVPVWLLEGFADYVALRDVDLPIEVTAGQVIEQVRAEGLPDALPGANEFNTRTTHLGAAYEAAWLACRTLVEHGSEEALVALYQDVSQGTGVEVALEEHFGLTAEQLVQLWRADLEEIAR